MIPISERFRVILDALESTPYKFATDHELGKVSIYNILSGKTRPNSELLERICDVEPRISAEYLLRGQGEPLRDMKTPSNMETMRTLIEMQAYMNQFIEKKAKALQD